MSHHVGYKKIQNGYIVKLAIKGETNELRENVKRANAPFAKFRCSKALVLDIYHSDTKERIDEGYGLHDKTFLYKIGEIVEVKDYGNVLSNACSAGIHYFLSEEPAYFWGKDVQGYTGEYKTWHPNGQLKSQGNYKNGLKEGLWEEWCFNGTLSCKGNYKNDEKYGMWESYYLSGRLHTRGTYVKDVRDGMWRFYYTDGKPESRGNYKNGWQDGMWTYFHPTGELNCQGMFEKNKRKGVWTFYKNGQISTKLNLQELSNCTATLRSPRF